MSKKNTRYKIDARITTRAEFLKEEYKYAEENIKDPETRRAYLKSIDNTLTNSDMRITNKQRMIGVFVGIGLILLFVAASIFFPDIVNQFYRSYVIILALAGGLVAYLLTGYIKVNWVDYLQAGGGIGVAVAIFLALKDNDKIFSIRVIVQCENSKILNTGRVLLILGQEPREAVLGPNNDALFENIPLKYYKSRAAIGLKGLENYSLENPDSLYILNDNNIIYVKTKLLLNNIISGYLTFKKKPIKDVEISIGDIKDTSDVNGYYKVILPQENLKKEQLITFFKKNTLMKRKTISLDTLQVLDIALDK